MLPKAIVANVAFFNGLLLGAGLTAGCYACRKRKKALNIS